MIPSTSERVRCRDVLTATGNRVNNVVTHRRLCCARGRRGEVLNLAALRLARGWVRAYLSAHGGVPYRPFSAGEGRAHLLARVCGSRGVKLSRCALVCKNCRARVVRVPVSARECAGAVWVPQRMRHVSLLAYWEGEAHILSLLIPERCCEEGEKGEKACERLASAQKAGQNISESSKTYEAVKSTARATTESVR